MEHARRRKPVLALLAVVIGGVGYVVLWRQNARIRGDLHQLHTELSRLRQTVEADPARRIMQLEAQIDRLGEVIERR